MSFQKDHPLGGLLEGSAETRGRNVTLGRTPKGHTCGPKNGSFDVIRATSIIRPCAFSIPQASQMPSLLRMA